jgi:hypothetical protein
VSGKLIHPRVDALAAARLLGVRKADTTDQ